MTIKLTKQSNFVTFDGSLSITTEHQRPDRYRHIELANGDIPRIAQGGGYSYSAASFGENVLVQEMTKFNRLLEFNQKQLTLKIEPGVRLIDLLNWAIKRQLYFPVIPGYPLITVGGCIASDVHGKNPFRDGTFSNWVKHVTVFHPKKGYQEFSRELNPDLFALTCGGFGLTGIITNVTLQLIRLPASHVCVSRASIQNLKEAVQVISQSEDDFSYSWHDATPTARFGKGIVFNGRWGENNNESIQIKSRYITARSRGVLPFSFWNSATTRIANLFFDVLKNFEPKVSKENILRASFPFATNPYYHKLFGRAGLREAQLLIPDENINNFFYSLKNLILQTRAPTMMISLKRFKGEQKSLSQTGQGYLVAIDCFYNHKTEPFFNALDQLMIASNGQPNITKDSRLPKSVAEISIRHYHKFNKQLIKYDPERLFKSELSMRIGL